MVCVRGFKNNNYLILDHPTHKNLPIQLDDNTPCIIRFVHDGRAVGFRSWVLGSIKRPYPLLFVKFPENIETSTIRQYERFQVNLRACLTPNQVEGRVDKYPPANICNLSEGGCLIENWQQFKSGDTAFLTVFLPDGDPIIDPAL